MSKFNTLVNNFKTGEFSPKMSARTDIEEYKSSCETILNMFPMKQGGVNKRVGSRIQSTVALPSTLSGNGLVRTIPFIFSKEEAYVVTIDTSRLPVVPALNRNITNLDTSGPSDPLLYSIPASDFITILNNSSADSAFVLGDLGRTFEDQNNAPVDDGFYTPFYRSQYDLAGIDTRGFHYAQSGDVLILTHNSGRIPPLVITRNAVDSFSVEWYHKFDLRTSFGFQITEDYYFNVLRSSFRAPNTRDIVIGGNFIETHRLFSSILTGGGNPPFTRTNGQLNLYDVYELYSTTDFFTDDKLGSTIRIEALIGADIKSLDFVIVDTNHTGNTMAEAPDDSPFRCLAITSRLITEDHEWDDGTFNQASTAQDFPVTDNWSEASWSDEYGFPRSVCFFEQRLIFGGSKRDVDTVWASRTGNINVFLSRKFAQDLGGSDETGLNNFIPSNIPEKDKVIDIFGNVNLETDPLDFRPSSQEINSIQWLSSGQALMVGTLGAEYVVSGGQKALSSTSITYRRQTSRGGSPIMPVRIDDEVIYVLRDGRACYNFRFNESNGSYLSNEVSLHADHIVDVGDGETVSQFSTLEFNTPRNIMLAITSDNKLVGFTYSPANEVLAWHRFDFAEDKIHSVTSIPSPDGDVDDIWLFIERDNNGVPTYSHEKVGMDFMGESLDDPNNISNFLDGSNTFVNVPSGGATMLLPHLVGRTDVALYIDGSLSQENITVTGAGIPIPECNTAVAGIPFDAFVETNDLNVGGDFGSSVGLTQRIDRVHAILFRSSQVGAGHNKGKIDPVKNLDSVLSTGNYPLDFPFGPAENGAKVKIQSLGAYPLTVLGIVARGQTNDR